MVYLPIIFPDLPASKWVEVDLNACAKRDFPNTGQDNPLLDGGFCDAWVNNIAVEKEADFTYGGHFEDRGHLWRGYYEGARNVTHLGVDYNVPAGTRVSAPRDCVVVHRFPDLEMENGWGGRLILRLSEAWQNAPFLVIGHLAHRDLPMVGEHFRKGEVFGQTGVIEENGGWFPHLHVQSCSAEFFKRYEGDLEQLDGYYLEDGHPYELAPDPTRLVGGETAIRLPELRRDLSTKRDLLGFDRK